MAANRRPIPFTLAVEGPLEPAPAPLHHLIIFEELFFGEGPIINQPQTPGPCRITEFVKGRRACEKLFCGLKLKKYLK